MKSIRLGDLSIPITQYASQGNAVLGIRDSGKSYSSTYLAEQLYAAGVPFVAFDPSGVWKFLRVPGKGAGLPVVVAGGKSPDLPLTPQSAPEIVRAAMRANVSLVIDLYDIHLSKADWSRIVESCIRVLLYENGEHGLRHIFIEEGAEFAPQQVTPDKAKVYAEVEKLARIGGNALLGYTLINQRAEQVNKAVLELCDCLFLHRQKGKNSLTSLSKWLDYSQSGDTKKIIQGLPALPSGQCWVWPANADHATLVKMPEKNTFHPDRRALIANPAAANVKRVDATEFVTELKGSLEKFVEEEKANDPKALKARIAELERELRKPKDLAVDVQALDREYARGYNDAGAKVYLSGWEEHKKAVAMALDMIPPMPPMLGDPPLRIPVDLPPRPNSLQRLQAVAERLPPPARGITTAKQSRNNVSEGMKPVEQRVLDALAEAEQLSASNPDRSLLALLSGYTHIQSTGFVKALGALRTAGHIDYPAGGTVCLTDSGRDLANMPARPTTPEELQQRVCELIGGAASKVLQPLLDAYPKTLPRQTLAEAAGYSHIQSTGFVKVLGKLRTLGFVDYPRGTGTVVAMPVLFLE